MQSLRALLAALWMALPAAADPGALVIVGGALAPDNEAIYQAILDRGLAGKPICVLPTASGRPKSSMASYVRGFRGYGGRGAAAGVAITTGRRGRAATATTAVRLEGCGGVFFTGGDQSRIVDVLRPGGEPSAADRAIRDLWQRGGVVAGTSAGAAMMSDPMIGGGTTGEAFTYGVTVDEDSLGVWVRDGMGFLPSVLVDQHCLARGRFGRLIVAVAGRPGHRLGMCVDEDTAVVIENEQALVIGGSAVAVLDLESSSRSEGGRGFRNGRLWLLGAGDRFDLAAGRGFPSEGKRIWQAVTSEAVPAPAEPWVQDAFHRLVVRFVGSAAESASVGEAPARVQLRKAGGFHALGRGSADPSALFAGPIEIDWVP